MPNLRRAGESTVVLDCGEGGAAVQPRLWALARDARTWPHVHEAVVGDGNLSLAFDCDSLAYDSLRAQLERAFADVSVAAPSGTVVEIAVRYGGAHGEDLEAVARACGLSAADVVALHTTAMYTVAFIGFLPGFAYLDGLPEQLRLPRRAQPRTRVPAGSVAIAGAQSGIYPVASPGGWHILGHTQLQMFDPRREPVTLLQPGDRVRFIAL